MLTQREKQLLLLWLIVGIPAFLFLVLTHNDLFIFSLYIIAGIMLLLCHRIFFGKA